MTPTPSFSSSSCSDVANPRSPNFVAEYIEPPPAATLPDIDEMKTTWPSPRSIIAGTSACVIWIGARRLTSSARSICSGV